MSLRVRPARNGDVPSVARLCKSSMHATYGNIVDKEAMRPWLEDGGKMDKYLTANLQNMLVVEKAGSILGVGVIENDLIGLIWVDLGARGGGLGRMLLDACEAEISKSESVARLECFADNTDAIGFYEHLGWQVLRNYPDPASGVDMIEMHKSL